MKIETLVKHKLKLYCRFLFELDLNVSISDNILQVIKIKYLSPKV